jgi:hypothetical protein
MQRSQFVTRVLDFVRKRLHKREEGAVTIMVAAGCLALCGMAALGIDASLLINERRAVQIAADHASLSAAWASCRGGSPIGAGIASAERNGYTSGVSIIDRGGAWEASVESSIDAAFATVLGFDQLTTDARALADCTFGGGGRYAIFADSKTCLPKTLDWSGSVNRVTGAVHSNNELYMAGSLNSITGGTTYAGSITNGGTDNEFSPRPAKTAVLPRPVTFNIEDYVPGGSEATRAGARYYNFGSQKLTKDLMKSRGLYDERSQTVATGLYFTTGDIDISGNTTIGEATFVTSAGKISLAGEHNLRAFDPDGLLAFSNTDTPCFDYAVNFGGSNSYWQGIVYAPRGMVELNGSNNSTLEGSVIADTVKLNGSNIVFDAQTNGGWGLPKLRLLE